MAPYGNCPGCAAMEDIDAAPVVGNDTFHTALDGKTPVLAEGCTSNGYSPMAMGWVMRGVRPILGSNVKLC